MSDEVLDYVKLHLSRIPKAIKAEKPQFNTLKTVDNSLLYTVYKKIPIKDIQILISNTDRTTDVKKRFNNAVPLQDYIKENKDEFLKIAQNTSVEKIQWIEKQQSSFEDKIPYFIKYEKNYIWQIFYSSKDNQYFMLHPAKEEESEALFYLIKEKLEKNKKYVYVPICQTEIDTDMFEANKISDLENYIWSFTNFWPLTMEYVDEKGKKTFYIIGETKIQEGFKTKYRIVIDSEEKFKEIYTLVRVLFVLMTETKYSYKFTPCIDKKGSLNFFYGEKQMKIDALKEFIASETARQQNLKYEYKEKIENCNIHIEKLKQILTEQSIVYSEQERQIISFMNCKKSFFKKVRFFFTNNKKMLINRKKEITRIKEKLNETNQKDLDYSMEQNAIEGLSEIFTISDLIKTTLEANKEYNDLCMYEKDLEVLKLKQKNMIKKIENADKYLDEIEQHKKSLLEFWKFTNKDNQQTLMEGNAKEKYVDKTLPVFKYDEDLEELSAEVDGTQRKKFSIDEMEAIFVARYLLKGVNSVVTKSDTYVLDEEFEQLHGDNKNADHILDGIDDATRVKEINHKKFRETRRNVFEVLKFNQSTTLDDFKEKMREIGKLVNESYQKIVSPYEMDVYYAKRNKGFILGDIDPYKLLKDPNVDKLYKMKVDGNTHLIFLSNCIFYENQNKTLPLGMDEETSIITKVGDNKKVGDTEINILFEEDLFNAKVRTIRIMKEEKR